jgi:hypothetical protein
VNFVALQTSLVTGGAKTLGSSPGFYWGFQATLNPGRSGCTLVVSNSNSSSVTCTSSTTATDIKAWVPLVGHTGVSPALYPNTEFVNGLLPQPCRCPKGIRVKVVGYNSGATVIVFYGG